MIVVPLVCIFLANGIKATVVQHDLHEHPVLTCRRFQLHMAWFSKSCT
nr:protein 7b [Feline coronavirus]